MDYILEEPVNLIASMNTETSTVTYDDSCLPKILMKKGWIFRKGDTLTFSLNKFSIPGMEETTFNSIIIMNGVVSAQIYKPLTQIIAKVGDMEDRPNHIKLKFIYDVPSENNSIFIMLADGAVIPLVEGESVEKSKSTLSLPVYAQGTYVNKSDYSIIKNGNMINKILFNNELLYPLSFTDVKTLNFQSKDGSIPYTMSLTKDNRGGYWVELDKTTFTFEKSIAYLLIPDVTEYYGIFDWLPASGVLYGLAYFGVPVKDATVDDNNKSLISLRLIQYPQDPSKTVLMLILVEKPDYNGEATVSFRFPIENYENFIVYENQSEGGTLGYYKEWVTFRKNKNGTYDGIAELLNVKNETGIKLKKLYSSNGESLTPNTYSASTYNGQSGVGDGYYSKNMVEISYTVEGDTITFTNPKPSGNTSPAMAIFMNNIP